MLSCISNKRKVSVTLAADWDIQSPWDIYNDDWFDYDDTNYWMTYFYYNYWDVDGDGDTDYWW